MNAIGENYSSSQITFKVACRYPDSNGYSHRLSPATDILSADAYRTIYVTGLPRHMTSWELAEICRAYGEVVSAQIQSDPDTGMQWRFGFVEFDAQASAARAATALHGSKFRGDVLAARQIEIAG